ncbi:MAG: histidinol-phosphate transaminase [Chloroflexota bacterium]
MKSIRELARREVAKLVPYVAGKPIDEVKRELGLTDVIKLASNENPLGPSPKALEAILAAAREGNIYPDSNAFRLRTAIGAKYGFTLEQVIIGDGSDELVSLIGQTFINPGDEAVMPWPSFQTYPLPVDLMGGVTVRVPLVDGRVDIAEMARRVTPRTKLVFICNPNNPSGTLLTRAQVESVVRSLPEHVIVVIDEAYAEYVESPDYPDSFALLREGRNIIVLRTFSKAYGLAGLRVGYGISTADIIDLMNRPRLAFNCNALAQAAAIAALSDSEHILASRRSNSEGKRYLYGEFDRLGIGYIPTEANFIFVNVGLDSREVFQRLQRRGVIVRPGDIFGYPGWQRVTIGTRGQNERFIAALSEVISELKG